jgi:hypothetical protein
MTTVIRLLMICIVVCVCCRDAVAQFSSGTAVLTISSGRFAVVAADSLGDNNGNIIKDECKIRYAMPDSIVAVGGMGKEYNTDFTAIGAKMLAQAHVVDQAGLGRVSMNWQDYLVKRFNREIITERVVMESFARINQETGATFVTLDRNKNILVSVIGVTLEMNASGHAVVVPGKLQFPTPNMGMNTVVPMAYAIQTLKNIDEDAEKKDWTATQLNRAIYIGRTPLEIKDGAVKVIERAKQLFGADVGGVVDLMSLDANGIDLAQVKPKCRIDVMTGR